MRILLLNQTFYPDVASTAQHLTDLALDLVKAGCKVTVLTDSRAYNSRRHIYPSYENYCGIKIRRIKSTWFGKRSVFSRAADFGSFNLNLALRFLFYPKFDVVVGLTSPPLIAFFGVLFCLIKGGKFIYWTMDLNPDEGVALGWLKKGSFLERLLDWISKFSFYKSSYIIALDRFMKERIEKKGIISKKIITLPPWSHDDLEFVPHDRNPFRRHYNLMDKFVVMYSGNHSVCHPLDTLLEAALLLKENKKIMFLFIGGGSRVRDVLEFKEKHSLPNVMYLPYQDRSKLKYSLSAADLHVITVGKDFVGIVHPCKVYNILRIGSPFVLIGPKESNVGDIISQEGVGYQVEHGDAKGLLEVISEVSKLSDRDKEYIRKKSQRLAQERYSRKVLSTKLVNLICGKLEG